MKIDEVCPKCGSPLGEVTETATGKKLQRCSTGSWNKETRKNDGCDYVKWLAVEPQTLDEKCPNCGEPLLLQTTRFGKRMKKCSAGGWDKVAKKATGCIYVEWINGTSEPLEEPCPKCGASLILYTTATGKKMKKCSTSGWDKEAKKAIGCDYIFWLKANFGKPVGGEEFLPPFPEDE
jgi:ssDNA-binding Zn-finger/Zn-ribbon topoisomerase 1